MKKRFSIYGGLLIAIAVYLFVASPNLNPLFSDGAFFWGALITIIIAIEQLIRANPLKFEQINGKPVVNVNKGNKLSKSAVITVVVIWLAYIIVSIGSSVVFHSSAYRDQLGKPVKKSFDSHMKVLDENQIPVVDKALASKLADKQLGTNTSLGSQVVLGEPTIQQVNGKLVWVVPLHHSGFFKWIANNEGAKGYIIVSATNMNDVEYVGNYQIKIQPNSYFFDDLSRHIRFGKGLFNGITDYSFELDETGKPYWVVTTYKNIRGFSLPEANGIILVDATNGHMEKYKLDEIPAWIDRVQPENFIMNQINNQGKYVHGIFNFSNKEKFMSSEGEIIVYNDNRCYLFTGITSVGSDESTIGFIMVDMITKEPILFEISGSTEYSASKSAEGKVQDLGYTATFPLILNVNGQPTYFMTLKDAEGLIKKYAFVSVKTYGVVGVGDTVAETRKDFDLALEHSGISDGTASDKGKKLLIEGTISRIASEVSGNSTTYSIILDEKKGFIFKVSSDLSKELVLSQPGDKISIEYPEKTTDSVISLLSFDNLEIELKK